MLAGCNVQLLLSASTLRFWPLTSLMVEISFFSTDSLLSFQWKVQVDVHEDALIADRGEVDCTPASTPNQPDIIIAMWFKNSIDFCFTFSLHLQDGMTSHTTSKISLLHCSTIHLLNFSFWIFQSRFVSWDAFYKDLLLYIWTSSTFPSTFVSWEAALIADKRTMHCTHAF